VRRSHSTLDPGVGARATNPFKEWRTGRYEENESTGADQRTVGHGVIQSEDVHHEERHGGVHSHRRTGSAVLESPTTPPMGGECQTAHHRVHGYGNGDEGGEFRSAGVADAKLAQREIHPYQRRHPQSTADNRLTGHTR
jgi:hypothetical protein